MPPKIEITLPAKRHCQKPADVGGFAVMIIENGLYIDALDISGVIAQGGKLDLRV